MRLRLKLPLAFAAGLLLLMASALFGLFELNRSIQVYQVQVQRDHDNALSVLGLLQGFKGQVQEWKDVLLRGKDAEAHDRYWNAFQTRESGVAEGVQRLLGTVDQADARELLTRFATAHQRMGQAYRQGLQAFDAADHDPTAGDQAVKGMDREPSRLLEDAAARIRQASLDSGRRAAENAAQATLISLSVMGIVCLIGAVGSLAFSHSVTQPLRQAVALSHAIAEGDLCRPISAAGRDEIAELLQAMASMQTRLARIVAQVRGGAEQVAHASAEIAHGNNDLSMRTEQQASALEQTAAAMDEMSETVQHNASTAEKANQLATTASQVAVEGGQSVQTMVGAVHEIHQSSVRISDITGVIDGIAFQTNILALNAAVEAARAGEQGRGFAVVASEVRVLAQRSAAAAREIKQLLSQSASQVQRGTAVADQASATMAQVVQAIGNVTTLMAEISHSSREQSGGVTQIGQAVQQIDQNTQQNAALVEQGAAAAEGLRRQAAELVAAVAYFRTPEAPQNALLPG